MGTGNQRKTPQPVFAVRGLLLGDCISELALELQLT
jgi:hypothetical protein